MGEYFMTKTLAYFLLECLPMIVFYATSHRLTFVEATGAYVIAMLFVIGIVGYTSRRLPYISIIFGIFVIGSGILTIFFDNPQIIILADSLYFFFGAIAILYSFYTRKTLLERLFSHTFALLPKGWQVISWQWVVIFIIAGVTNEIVRLTATPEWWIGFQFWRGLIIVGLTLLQFTIAHYYRDPSIAGRWGIKTNSSSS